MNSRMNVGTAIKSIELGLLTQVDVVEWLLLSKDYEALSSFLENVQVSEDVKLQLAHHSGLPEELIFFLPESDFRSHLSDMEYFSSHNNVIRLVNHLLARESTDLLPSDLARRCVPACVRDGSPKKLFQLVSKNMKSNPLLNVDVNNHDFMRMYIHEVLRAPDDVFAKNSELFKQPAWAKVLRDLDLSCYEEGINNLIEFRPSLAIELFNEDRLTPKMRLKVLAKASVSDVATSLRDHERALSVVKSPSWWASKGNVTSSDEISVILHDNFLNIRHLDSKYVSEDVLVEVLWADRTSLLDDGLLKLAVIDILIDDGYVKTNNVLDALIAASPEGVSECASTSNASNGWELTEAQWAAIVLDYPEGITNHPLYQSAPERIDFQLWYVAIHGAPELVNKFFEYKVEGEQDVMHLVEDCPTSVTYFKSDKAKAYLTEAVVAHAIKHNPSLINNPRLVAYQTPEIAEQAVLADASVLSGFNKKRCYIAHYTAAMEPALDSMAKDFETSTIVNYPLHFVPHIIRRVPDAIYQLVPDAELAMSLMPLLKDDKQKEYAMSFLLE